MSILKRLSTRENLKLMGVHLPLSVYNYLSLYSLAKGISKTKLFKGFIDKWIEEEGDMEESLLEELIIRVQSEWRKEKKEHPRAVFKEFITEMKTELLSKGLTKEQVEEVSSRFE